MFITVSQLAEKINNKERFTLDELHHEQVNTFEILIKDTDDNIIHNYYCTCSLENAKKKAIDILDYHMETDKKVYNLSLIKIK